MADKKTTPTKNNKSKTITYKMSKDKAEITRVDLNEESIKSYKDRGWKAEKAEASE